MSRSHARGRLVGSELVASLVEDDRFQRGAVMMKPTRWLVLASTMPEPSKTRHFLDAYRGAFETFDVEAIADLFSYPCQITSDAGEVTVTTVGTREAWVPQVERLVSAYREIGVRSAAFLELHVIELTSRLAQVTVRWALADGKDRPIYDFEASYSLADHGCGMRITAITHNEMPRLRAAIEDKRPG